MYSSRHKGNGSMSFLDILATLEHIGRLTTSIYWKSIHTDQYMHCNSHHYIGTKHSNIKTLTHRSKIVSCTPELLGTE